MKFVLMTYLDPASWNSTKEEQEQERGAWMAYMEALNKAGVLKSNQGLAPPSSATTVRVVNGKSQVLDGPYVDSKEQVGGIFVLDVADLDAAIQWAARCPAASKGAIEVRPAWG